MRIYITHCTRGKNKSLENTDIKVPPDRLYTPRWIQRFMNKCKEMGVNWAILSDEYGIWFPHIKNKYYEKDPDTIVKRGKIVDAHKFWELVSDFDRKLRDYDEIQFYRQPGGRPLHPTYQKLLQATSLKNKVKLFCHISEIT